MDRVQDPTRRGSPLLNLPSELRLRIYDFVSPCLLSSPPSTYIGLFLSCRTIHHEVCHEAIKDTYSLFASLTHDSRATITPQITPSNPDSLAALRTITVVLPKSELVQDLTSHHLLPWSRLPSIVRALLCLHLKSLTIVHYDDGKGKPRVPARDPLLRFIRSLHVCFISAGGAGGEGTLLPVDVRIWCNKVIIKSRDICKLPSEVVPRGVPLPPLRCRWQLEVLENEEGFCDEAIWTPSGPRMGERYEVQDQ